MLGGVAALAADPPASSKPTPSPVRSESKWGTALIAEGCSRSGILSKIVGSLKGSNVIVYVQPSARVPRGTDGYLAFTGESGGYRYLRVTLQPRLPRMELLATLAHELQHAREVAEALEVVDQASFEMLFSRIGNVNRHGYDTAAARSVGRSVWVELQAGAPFTQSLGR
jgi:hypothetical protein